MSGAEIQGVLGAAERLRFWVAPATPADHDAVFRAVRTTAEELRARGEDLGAEVLEALAAKTPRSALADVSTAVLSVLERRLVAARDRQECHAARLSVTHHKGSTWREARVAGVRVGEVAHNALGWWGNAANGTGTTIGPRPDLARLLEEMMGAEIQAAREVG